MDKCFYIDTISEFANNFDLLTDEKKVSDVVNRLVELMETGDSKSGTENKFGYQCDFNLSNNLRSYNKHSFSLEQMKEYVIGLIREYCKNKNNNTDHFVGVILRGVINYM